MRIDGPNLLDATVHGRDAMHQTSLQDSLLHARWTIPSLRQPLRMSAGDVADHHGIQAAALTQIGIRGRLGAHGAPKPIALHIS
jgi:hypothetical protein